MPFFYSLFGHLWHHIGDDVANLRLLNLCFNYWCDEYQGKMFCFTFNLSHIQYFLPNSSPVYLNTTPVFHFLWISWPCLHQVGWRNLCFSYANDDAFLLPTFRYLKLFLLCSGWRPDPTDKCVQCVKLESAEKRSSLYTAEEAQVNKTPGDLCLDLVRLTVTFRLCNHITKDFSL